MIADVAALLADHPRVGTRKLQDRRCALLRNSGHLVPRKRRGTRTTYARHA